MIDHMRMADELNRDYQFSDGKDQDSYRAYLKSEPDRIAILSRQHHLEKLERERHARWFTEETKGEMSNSVLEDLKHGRPPLLSREPAHLTLYWILIQLPWKRDDLA